jgi:hypothetical protein
MTRRKQLPVIGQRDDTLDFVLHCRTLPGQS